MMSRETFSTYHPGITFLFFVAAIVFGMCFIHPVFWISSCILSAAYVVTIKGRKSLKLLLIMLLVFAVVSLINPLFTAEGNHVLAVTPWGRPYTLEALCYGMAAGGMFVTVLLWFSAYNAVMSSDKFLFLFGRMIPSISLVLTMILRLVPLFQKKAMQIAGARKCIGMSSAAETRKEKINAGMAVTSALTSWALEGGIITADSMQSRGFGSGRRTSFSIYRMDSRDIFLLLLMIVLAVFILLCAAMGGMKTAYIPDIELTGPETPYMTAGIIAYVIFMAIPTVLNIVEGIRWHYLRSGI